MMGSGLQIWGEMFPSHGDIWDTSESVSHPLFAVDHSVYRSSALARSMFVCLPLSISRSWSLNLYLERICLSLNGLINK